PRIDAAAVQEGEILRRVAAGRGHEARPQTEEGGAVGDVAAGAAALALQRVDQEGDVEDVDLVREDMLQEVPGEAHDVVERHGSRYDDAHVDSALLRRRRSPPGALPHAKKLLREKEPGAAEPSPLISQPHHTPRRDCRTWHRARRGLAGCRAS